MIPKHAKDWKQTLDLVVRALCAAMKKGNHEGVRVHLRLLSQSVGDIDQLLMDYPGEDKKGGHVVPMIVCKNGHEREERVSEFDTPDPVCDKCDQPVSDYVEGYDPSDPSNKVTHPAWVDEDKWKK